ncbi:MAG: cation:proton antiporter [Candidatus Pacebacteria bacterium]|jgi:NhaP-type Na+/H+ or K+/H+ antiporter|nr:cation:proton antiporter [Candidatus Paceibacterota bacterium]
MNPIPIFQSTSAFTRKYQNYFKIILLFAVAIAINAASVYVFQYLLWRGEADPDAKATGTTLWVMSLILFFGWACLELTKISKNQPKGNIFPSFALQLLLSIILHDALSPLSFELRTMVVTCTILGSVILKFGGDEVERTLFRKIALPTIFIAVVGYIVMFSSTLGILFGLNYFFPGFIDPTTAVLFSALMGSTDPAALMSTLTGVPFKERHKKLVGVSVAESAINDAVCAIFVTVLIDMAVKGYAVDTFASIFSGLAEVHNLVHFGLEVSVGVLAGLVGWACMWLYERHKFIHNETNFDLMIPLAVPLFTYLLSWIFFGNGFLAAFVAGLMANYNHNNHGKEKDQRKSDQKKPIFDHTLKVMDTKIESIAKPVIFMMAGPLISLGDLANTAGTGFVISLLFILVARPLAVFSSLLLANGATYVLSRIFPSREYSMISWREMLFMCVVGERGVIPIILTVVTLAKLPHLTTLLPFVAWVVIWTLTLLPAITPWWARKLDLTETVGKEEKNGEEHNHSLGAEASVHV